MSLLSLRGVNAGYDQEDVLHDISLTVMRGEFLCIVGPNGCGKTTLLRVMAGLLASRGEILLHQTPLSSMKRRTVAAHVALLSQHTQLYFAYSVYDTVMFGRYLHQRGVFRAPSREDRARVREALETVGMWPMRERRIDALSGGQLQRVFLARTLAQEPAIILLDEPTNHLDLTYQVALMESLKAWLCQPERAVVGVLHDLNLALAYADRMALMHEGTIAAIGEAQEALRPQLLERVFGMDVGAFMRRALSRWEAIDPGS